MQPARPILRHPRVRLGRPWVGRRDGRCIRRLYYPFLLLYQPAVTLYIASQITYLPITATASGSLKPASASTHMLLQATTWLHTSQVVEARILVVLVEHRPGPELQLIRSKDSDTVSRELSGERGASMVVLEGGYARRDCSQTSASCPAICLLRVTYARRA